ncbi:hypothetical protein HEP84_41635 [Streptomyces sp. RLB1-33]|uniref:hypothetical protein n=1 Tax=Streptomyces mirabilis TaxID=68239 RepID=UPI00143ECEDF|nr:MULTISPECIES: hypothetical protein [Streptomyces]QIY74639.1 hypothetical protein HEP84_41635 [Streptomyces sp. RLB1-33]QUW78160.1 hypothetical protein SMIR_02565 [Streptomyces mirabilis]
MTSLAVSGGTASATVPAGAADRAADSQNFSITSDDQQNQFVQAVGTPNATVMIAGNVNLDLSGLSAKAVGAQYGCRTAHRSADIGRLLGDVTQPRSHARRGLLERPDAAGGGRLGVARRLAEGIQVQMLGE